MTDTNPLVSIIIPTYNRANLLRSAIKSALNQTYDNIEVIVVDDASTDETKEVVEKFGSNNIRYTRHPSNKGANAARNTGINFSNGEYMCFLDSDEVLLPEKIEKQISVFTGSDEDVGVVYCSTYSEFNECLKDYSDTGNEGDIYTELLSFGMKILTSQLLIKKECFKICGLWDPDLPSFNEYDLCLRIAQKYKFKYVSEPLVVSRYHSGDQISTSESNTLNGLGKIIEKWGEEMEKHVGEDASEDFQDRFVTKWYRASALFEAHEKHRLKSIKQAVKYYSRSKDADIKFIISFFCSLVDKRVYEFARGKWFCMTAETKVNELETTLISDTENNRLL